MTVWEIRGFGCLAVASTELECWLDFLGMTGTKMNGYSFMCAVGSFRRVGIVAREVRA